jgi:hypothetical protein
VFGFNLFVTSLKRNFWKLGLLLVVGTLLFGAAQEFPLELGPTLAPLAYSFGLAFYAAGAAMLVLCIIDPHVSSVELVEKGKLGHVSSAVLFLARCIMYAAVMWLMMSSVKAQEIPKNAVDKIPVVRQELIKYWPSLEDRSWIPAQIDKETCITPTHSKCWNERAELKTHRERGVGLGQHTKAFHANGAIRFDALAEIRLQYPKELAGFTWENPYDARLQIRALVLKERDLCKRIDDVTNEKDRMRMCLVAYNGGEGGLRKDRLTCKATKGCDHRQWYGHVELTSLKSKVPMPGYGGQSPFSISRKYPKEIEYVRRPKYILAMG